MGRRSGRRGESRRKSRSRSSDRGSSPDAAGSKMAKRTRKEGPVRRDEALDQMFAEFKSEIKADMSRQIDSVLDKRIDSFIGKVGERLSVVEERTTAMAIQVQKVEKGQAMLQNSMDQVLAELSRMRLDPGSSAAGSSGAQPRAQRAQPHQASTPSGATSTDGFKVFVQGFSDEQPRNKLMAFHSTVIAQLTDAATHGSRALIGPAASTYSVLFGTQDQAQHFLREVRALPDGVRFPVGDAAGDVITFQPQRSGEPTRYGRALSPVWEVLAPLLRASAKFRAVDQAKFMTDPRRGLMRIISSEKVWRLCEVEDAPEGGPPRLRINKEVFQEFGLTQANWEAVANSFDGAAVRAS